MLETWVKHGGGPRDTSKSFAAIRKQVIWGNQLIKHKNRSLLYKHWINDNIIYNLGQEQNLQTIALPTFYRNMLETWVEHGGGPRDISFADIRNQVIGGESVNKTQKIDLCFINVG